ncbi:MAG: hypothetical protein FJ011_18120 [Chloroflexi bacterium]|nr:hypothetical protein [Chloroflexota bacterium]
MTRMDELLSDVFYRRSCPQPEALGDYHLGRLSPADRLALALHLRECPHCTRELALYAASEQKASMSPADMWDRARNALTDLVDRVLWAAATPAVRPVPALRGGEAAVQLYAAEGVQIALDVQPATGGYRRRRLGGKVEPAGAPSGVELWSQSELLDSLLADESGYFAFDRLRPGTYFLCVRRNGAELWVEVVL